MDIPSWSLRPGLLKLQVPLRYLKLGKILCFYFALIIITTVLKISEIALKTIHQLMQMSSLEVYYSAIEKKVIWLMLDVRVKKFCFHLSMWQQFYLIYLDS